MIVDVILAVYFTLTDENMDEPQLSGGPLEGVGQFAFSNLHFHWGPTDCTGSEHELDGIRYTTFIH